MPSVGLGDGVAPLARLQVDIQPLGMAQLPRSYEDQGSQPQGATHDQRPLVTFQHS